MTSSPRAPELVFSDRDQAFVHLRRSGARLTTARRLLLDALFVADGALSAEELARRAGGPGEAPDVASVYRNLDLFERLGLVRHVHVGHGPGLYALAGDGEREYLVCERCGLVHSVERSELDPVRELVERRFGFAVRFSHFPITGLCRDCEAAVRAGAPGDDQPQLRDHHTGAAERPDD